MAIFLSINIQGFDNVKNQMTTHYVFVNKKEKKK